MYTNSTGTKIKKNKLTKYQKLKRMGSAPTHKPHEKYTVHWNVRRHWIRVVYCDWVARSAARVLVPENPIILYAPLGREYRYFLRHD